VTPGGSRQWIFRYRHNGRRRDMGLGSTELVTLDQARSASLECRKLLAQGGDPIERRRQVQAQRRVEFAKRTLFADCAAAYFNAHGAGWSEGYRKRWQATLATHAGPVLDTLPVSDIDTQLILRVLSEMWEKTPVLANKLRNWLEAIIDYATAHGLRGEAANPARWRGHLDKLLMRPSKVAKVEHQVALPWREIPAFFAAIKADDSVLARAVELIALSNVRKMEGLEAQWGEFDLARRLWAVPAKRMKADRDHRVALSVAAVELLDEMRWRAGGHPLPANYVFALRGKPLHHATPRKLLNRLGYLDRMTVHGLRSSFAGFAAEATVFPREMVELALAHNVGDETERAYQRSDMFGRRLALANAWGNYCTGRPIDPAALVDGRLPTPNVA